MDIQPVTKIWRTGKGELIRICDMVDSHLNNTIQWMEKKALSNNVEPDLDGKFPFEKMPSAYPFLLLEQQRRYFLELDRKDEFKEKLKRRLKSRNTDPIKARSPVKRRRKPKEPEKRKKAKNPRKLQRGLEL